MAASRSGSSTWMRRRRARSPRALADLAAARRRTRPRPRPPHWGSRPPLRSDHHCAATGLDQLGGRMVKAGQQLAQRRTPLLVDALVPGFARAPSRRGRLAPCSLWQRPREQAAKDVLSRLRGAVLVHGRGSTESTGRVHEHGAVVGDHCGTAFVASHESSFGRGILRRSGMSAPMRETNSFMLALNCGKSVSACSPSV